MTLLTSMEVGRFINETYQYDYQAAVHQWDHLGSASLLTKSNGTSGGVQEFDPWGKVRTGGTVGTQTRINFTGQKLDDTGLLYYHARMYDPSVGRFVSPDTIVPGSERNVGLTVDFHEGGALKNTKDTNALITSEGFRFQMSSETRSKIDTEGSVNPQAINRYSYVRNNPLRYNDPTGHTWYLSWEEARDFARGLHDLADAIAFGGSIADVLGGFAAGSVAGALLGAIAATIAGAVAVAGVVGILALAFMIHRFANAIERMNDDGSGNAGLGVAIQFNPEETLDGGFFEIMNRSTGESTTFSAPLMNWLFGRNSKLGFMNGLGNDRDPSVPNGWFFNTEGLVYFPGGHTQPRGYSCADPEGQGSHKKCRPGSAR